MQQSFTHTHPMKYLPEPTARPRRTLLLILASLFLTPGIFPIRAANESDEAGKFAVVPHRLVADNQTYIRDQSDGRNHVWTDDPAKVRDMLKAFGIDPADKANLQQGEIVAVFFNDHFTEDFNRIVENKKAGTIFADYTDSGIRIKMKDPGEGKKYTHLTAVIFKPSVKPRDLGIRTVALDGGPKKK